jgi:hypothetical protein
MRQSRTQRKTAQLARYDDERRNSRMHQKRGFCTRTLLQITVRSMPAAIALGIGLLASNAASAERRCGWYMNPTPGNLLLSDKEGEWWITTQMHANGPDALGLANAPWRRLDSKRKHYVQTQSNGHGYSCACMIVETNAKDKRITKVISGEDLPLGRCQHDRSLPKP